jgi:L,D-transpeptidase YcbB
VRIFSKPRWFGFALLLVLAGSKGAIPLASDWSVVKSFSTNRLSLEGEILFETVVKDGRLPDLRWPDFSDRFDDVRDFYGLAPHSLAWVGGSGPTRQAIELIAIFRSAESKGLRAEDYDSQRWTERLLKIGLAMPAEKEAQWIKFDLAVTICAIRYISDLHRGRVDPREMHPGFPMTRGNYALAEFLRKKVMTSPNVEAELRAVEPAWGEYQRTLQALHNYREFARVSSGEPLPAFGEHVSSIKPGDSYSGLARLKRSLIVFGDLQPEILGGSNDEVYEETLVSAIKTFQVRHGLDADGVIGARTLDALNTPINRRVVQLELALERWRWLPDTFFAPPIIVNIPEFRAYAYNEELSPILSTRVIVGKARKQQTPIFAAEMKYVIFRPPWNVPFSIQRSEMIPEILNNPAYLMAKGYQIVNRAGDALSTPIVDEEMLEELRSGHLSIRQPPGPQNALGLIKFDLPNDYDVYMHSTPAVSLFAKSRRDFSHGCIRVEDVLALAVWILRGNQQWPVERMLAAMDGEKTIRVKIEKPIPVLILYSTAVVTGREVRFFEDLYGHDAALEKALARNYSPRVLVKDVR